MVRKIMIAALLLLVGWKSSPNVPQILDIRDMTPPEYLIHLRSCHYQDCQYTRWAVAGWVEEEHLPGLFDLLDSDEKCALPVRFDASPHTDMSKGSTVGREAGLMIKNFMGQRYPARLGSRISDADKEELRKWWRGYCGKGRIHPLRLADAEIPADTVVIRFVDSQGRAVPNVGVGSRGRASTIGQSPWKFGDSYSTKALSDANGIAVLDYRASRVGKNISLYALQSERQLAGTWRLDGDVFGSLVTLKLEPACHVTGRATCSAWHDRGLPVARTWVEVRQDGRTVASFGARPEFEFFLSPGSYQLEVEGQELVSTTVELNVAPNSRELAIETIDLVPNKLGSLIGTPAPELDHISNWVQGPPVKLADLRGQHVLLHFCNWDRPARDLPQLADICDAFDDKHLKVVVVINYLPPTEQLRPHLEKMEAVLGRALPCSVAVDADGGTEKVVGYKKFRIGATFLAYGVFGQYVNSRTLLIEPDGRLARRCYILGSESQKFIAELTGLLGTQRKTPDWEVPLNAVYGLAEGELLKCVRQPFMPERRIFQTQCRARRGPIIESGPRRDDHVMYMRCEWDGRLRWPGGGSSPVRLGYLLWRLGVRRADLAGPAELLRYDLSGDWVFRKGTSLRERRRALETYLKKEFGLAIRIEERDVEKEVIVARGKFKLCSLATARNRDVVHVYTSEEFTERDGPPFDFREGTLRQFLLSQDCTGLGLDHVADETDSSDVRIKWLYNPSWNNALLRTDPAKLDRYLDLIARQTSLSFTRERRLRKTWHVDWAR